MTHNGVSLLEQKINNLHNKANHHNPKMISSSIPCTATVLATPVAAITGVGISAALVGAFEAGRSYQGGLYMGAVGLGTSLVYACLRKKGKNTDEEGKKGEEDGFYLD